jgi:hypothetical protein
MGASLQRYGAEIVILISGLSAVVLCWLIQREVKKQEEEK